METLKINGTNKTPTVLFDPKSGILEIKGRSIPEDSVVFYNPLVAWVNQYLQNPKFQTIVNIKLEYLNSSSSKWILYLFRVLEQIKTMNKEIRVNWYYENDDDDMEDACSYYQSLVAIPIVKIPTE